MRDPLTALLPLTHGAPFTHVHVLTGIADLFPALTSRLGLVAPGGFRADGEGTACAIAIGPNRILVEMFPVPPFFADPTTMEVHCPAWYGPRSGYPRCNAHVVLTCTNDGADTAATVAAAAAVSMVAASMMSIVPVEEVIWTTGLVSTEPQAFQRMALRLTIPEVRVEHWVRIRMEPLTNRHGQNEGWILLSQGLAPFLGREIETIACRLPPQELKRLSILIIEYLLLHSPPLGADTPLFVPDLDEVRAHPAPHGRITPGPVMQIWFAAMGQAGPPWAAGSKRPTIEQDGTGFGKRGLSLPQNPI